ncbi:MAG: FkbM family methyltransferase [Steroidobacteraceae bacterium]
MRLNLKDWLERRAYFSGQLYQRDLEKVITTILRKGDCFIDIGANIGLVSLLAASRIGKSGRLIAVEANPAVFARLKGHLESNPLGMPIIALNLALGDSSSAAFMHVSSAHTGTGTLTLGQGSVPVSIEPADRVIAIPDDDQPVCIKIDVEGYECRVLKGMSKLLSRRDVALIVEVSRDMLVRIGDSSKSLHELLAAAGFSCYLIRHRIGRWGESLRFERTDCALDEWQYDAIYVKPGSSFERRMMPYAR